ncbi:hypothetical protein KBG31_01475 [Patescibacteria group bacterium]|nr:hypothetical protein [Patescibacteria group bacterium]
MNLLRKIPNKYLVLIIFTIFVGLHLSLLNINSAEWGDSYRILRASEHLRSFNYPTDEKRPPLFSLFLAFRPIEDVDPILWGRIFMLFVSCVNFYLFYLLAKEILEKDYQKICLALLFFTFNPVLLYWSLRIYADLFFTLWVLLGFLLVLRSPKFPWNVVAISFVAFLAILTRFEGYILAFAFGTYFFLRKSKNGSFELPLLAKENFLHALTYTIFLFMLLIPYWLWRNPFNSSYFSETSTMPYDIKTCLVFIFSLVFAFGYTSAAAFFVTMPRKIFSFALKVPSVIVFIVLELLLILLWPAAIPRLFAPIIPFLILFLASVIIDVFNDEGNTSRFLIPLSLILLVLYPVAQKIFALQFLLPSYKGIGVLFLINFASVYFLYKRNVKLFILSILISSIFWSLGVIFLHKDIYYSLQKGAFYAAKNLEGTVAYNDVSSISSWYLKYSPIRKPSLYGTYFEYGTGSQLDLDYLKNKGYDYLLITNEHNPSLNIDFEARPHLEVINTFEKVVNGKLFFTKVVKVKN